MTHQGDRRYSLDQLKTLKLLKRIIHLPVKDQLPPKMLRVQFPTRLKTTTKIVLMNNKKILAVRAHNVDPAERTHRLRSQRSNINLQTWAKLLR